MLVNTTLVRDVEYHSEQTYFTPQSVLPFSKLNKLFFGYFDPENIFLDNENTQFSG